MRKWASFTFDLFEVYLGVVVFSALIVSIFLEVFFRYVLNAALVWYDEFASYLLVWLTFYGAVVAAYRRRHIGFEMVVERLLPGTRRVVELVGEASVLGFQVVLFYYGWVLTQRMGDETAVSLQWVRMGWVYSVLPVTGGLMLVISLMRLVEIASGNRRAGEEREAWSGSSSE